MPNWLKFSNKWCISRSGSCGHKSSVIITFLTQQTETVRLEEIHQLKDIDLQQKANQIQQLGAELQQKDVILRQKNTEVQRLQEQIETIQVSLAW